MGLNPGLRTTNLQLSICPLSRDPIKFEGFLSETILKVQDAHFQFQRDLKSLIFLKFKKYYAAHTMMQAISVSLL